MPKPDLEYKFSPERRWKFDACWPAYMVALEQEGGAWVAGRHVRGTGYLADMEKYNEAAIRGWLLIRCTPTELGSGRIVPKIQEALRAKGWKA